MSNPVNMIKNFFKLESSAGILLGATAVLAIILKNSSFENTYAHFLRTDVVIQIGEFIINKPLLLWINDGLMAVFFLLVGLEIKREFIEGELSKKSQATLPFLAAAGGLFFPAILYLKFTSHNEIFAHGWAIPAATDIAFAIGIVTLLGNRVPQALKICLVAIAIIDDLAAIIIIALFYTNNLSVISLTIGLIGIFVLFVLNKRKVTKISPYIVTGIFMWACVLKSGVHATLAGVLLAFFIPLKIKNKLGGSPAKTLEHGLHPWVAYAILPLFAFANAGVSLKGLGFEHLFHPITLGIAVGLFFGKQIGVSLATYLSILLKLCKLPEGVNWKQYYAMSLITGVGFTMSLFIGTLAFNDIELQRYVRLGVLIGSIFSGSFGYLMLRANCPKANASKK